MKAVRKTLGMLVSLVALAGVLVTGLLISHRIGQSPRTDDAYLQADVVHMAPDVSGRIVELDVRDNQKVRKGQVLFRIDPEPYQLHVDQARAAVTGTSKQHLPSLPIRLHRRLPRPTLPKAESTPPKHNARWPPARWLGWSPCSGAAL